MGAEVGRFERFVSYFYLYFVMRIVSVFWDSDFFGTY